MDPLDLKKEERERYEHTDEDRGRHLASYLDSGSFDHLLASGHRQHVREALQDHVTPRSRVLSIGCGNGMWLRELVDAGPVDIAIGTDISLNELENAQSADIGDLIEWCQGDAERLPVDNSSIDVVIAAAVLHHLPQWREAVLDEFRRVLSNDGVFIFFDPMRSNPFYWVGHNLFEIREQTDAEVPLNPFQFRDTLDVAFDEVSLNGFYIISPVVSLVDNWVPISLTRVVLSIGRAEHWASNHGGFPLCTEVVGVAKSPTR